MTDVARNNLMHNIQTALLTLCTGAAIGCFIFFRDIDHFMTTQNEKDKEYEIDIITLTNQFNLLNSEIIDLQKQNIQQETRISILEHKK